MRGADSYDEALFSTIRLEEFLLVSHALHPLRCWLNAALSKMAARFAEIYEADFKGGRPSITPVKLMRAMLLQLLYSIRCERLLVEQISYNLLFRRFVGPAIEDTVWHHSVFSQNRDRMISFDAVTEMFNATVEMVATQRLLSGEHFCVNGTLIQAWPSHNSAWHKKDSSDDERPPVDWHGERRSIATHASVTDPESKLCLKSHAVPVQLSHLGRVLTDNRHGLVGNVHASTTADGCAERVVAATMLADVCRPDSRVTVGADKNFDTRGFVSACRKMKIPRMLHKIPDVLAVVSSTAASLHTTRHPASTGGNA